jgi:pre-mRNA cleavage complex 2 protein Pcf11
MGAYSLVDGSTRKEMENLLKAWEQPVPLSRDPRPVLPSEMTKDIKNALIRFHTVTLQHRQLPPQVGQYAVRPGSANIPHGIDPMQMQHLAAQHARSNTPTFSQGGYAQGPAVAPSPAPQHPFQIPSHPPSHTGTPVPHPATGLPPMSQPHLQSEVRQVILSANLLKALDPADRRTTELITTLQNLQTVLDMQRFEAPQLSSIQGELNKISTQVQSRIPAHTNAPAVSSIASSFSFGNVPVISTPPAAPAFSVPAADGPGAPVATQQHPLLAQLTSLLGPQPSQSLPPPIAMPTTSAGPPSDLLSQLRAAGLLPATPTPPPARTFSAFPKGMYGLGLSQDSLRS